MERMKATSDGSLYYASTDETRAYLEALEARATAGTPAERYAMDAELTAIINERGSRGPAILPGVIVSKREVARARFQLRLLIQQDNGGSYDPRTRFPGQQ